MNSQKGATGWAIEWISPEQASPPLGTKLLLFTTNGCAVIGHWQVTGYLAWAPLPKAPAWLKEKLDERFRR